LEVIAGVVIMPATFLVPMKSLRRTISLLALCFTVCFFAMNGTAISALYQYMDEDGNISYTDNPADPRYQYTPIPSYESEPRAEVKEGEQKPAEPLKQTAQPKQTPKKKELTGKEGMLQRIKDLEKALSTAKDDSQRLLIQNEIDGLRNLLIDIDQGKGLGTNEPDAGS
jgi:hypothetical protein